MFKFEANENFEANIFKNWFTDFENLFVKETSN
jgi:hypothetical protein